MKVGIIGLGHMGLLHLRNTRFIEGIQVVAAADKSKKALTEAKTYGVKHLYKDYRELFESVSLDAVVLSLPNFLHESSIVEAAEKGLHIFVEKPLARNTSECERIKEAVRRNNVKLVIGHSYRFFDHVQKLKSEYDQGTVGDIEIANLEHFTNGPFAHPLEPVPVREWWLNPALTGGGALIDQGYHLIDLFRWFFPEPEVLYVHLGYRYNLDLEDSALLMLRSRRTSTTGIIGVGWFQKMIFPQFNFRINLHGTAGFLSTDHFAPKNLYFHAAKESLKNILFKIAGKRINPLAYTYYYTSYFEELRKFFQRINADDSIDDLPTVDDGMETIRIIEESYKFAGTTNE
jgi:myo-inositol 2-dehydrogenase/D-chiro-inositol 1-dehydrogenase